MIDGELCIQCEEKEEDEDAVVARKSNGLGRRTSLRRLQRNYRLPDNIDPKTVHAEVSEEGVIQVSAMKRFPI